MQHRLALSPDIPERHAAWAISELAESIQDVCYYAEKPGLPTATLKSLHRCYRVLKPFVVWFYGDDNRLTFDPPNGRFQPKAVQK